MHRAPACTVLALLWLVLACLVSSAHAWPGPQQGAVNIDYRGVSVSNFNEAFKGADATPVGQIPEGAQRLETRLTVTVNTSRLAGGDSVHRVARPFIEIHLNGDLLEAYSAEAAQASIRLCW